jgi:VIT1/CCC1 family predicted Fe2+/Mn2+ transporter
LTSKTSAESEDELMLAIQVELDEIVTREICDSVYESAYVNPSLQGKSHEELDAECQNRKDAIMNVISSSVCMQRLYFIIRSSIMGVITGLLTYSFISVFLITNFFALVLLGLFTFAVSLFLSRLLDAQIITFSNIILRYLDRYERARTFILNRL